MSRALQLLVGGTLLFAVAVSYPAYRLGGEVSLVTAMLAGVLCLLPTGATLLWAGWAQDQSPVRQLSMLLGGTGLRMVVVLGAGLLLTPYYPGVLIHGLQGLFQALGDSTWAPAQVPTITTLWVWLLVFYLVTLGLEVAILVAPRAPGSLSEAAPLLPAERLAEASLNRNDS